MMTMPVASFIIGNYRGELARGHSGYGWYVWNVEYADDGSVFFTNEKKARSYAQFCEEENG